MPYASFGIMFFVFAFSDKLKLKPRFKKTNLGIAKVMGVNYTSLNSFHW